MEQAYVAGESDDEGWIVIILRTFEVLSYRRMEMIADPTFWNNPASTGKVLKLILIDLVLSSALDQLRRLYLDERDEYCILLI